jgi:hypothetical protein
MRLTGVPVSNAREAGVGALWGGSTLCAIPIGVLRWARGPVVRMTFVARNRQGDVGPRIPTAASFFPSVVGHASIANYEKHADLKCSDEL